MLPVDRFQGALDLARERAEEYREDEDGSIVIFSIFIFFAMIAFGGLAVDLMIYENERTHIQNSTDRAVLAAANLNQTVDPKVVVQDYLAKVGIAIDLDDVDVQEVGTAPVITGRQVSINVNATYETLLMSGVSELPYAAFSEAEEAVNDIEVSLILDVSGSMNENGKLGKMKVAAKDFVDGILAGSSDNRVSMSLVPYSTQVSAGPDLLGLMNTYYSHGYSHCVNFTSSQFTSAGIDHTVALEQTAEFDPWSSWRRQASWSNSAGEYVNPLGAKVCRDESYFHITPWSNNADALNDQIDDFTAQGNTSIDVAVKWGAALLDPTMNGRLTAMQASGADIDPEFDVRPHSYDFEDVLKFIVVMTDGINTQQYMMTDNQEDTGYNYKDGLTKYWQHPNKSVWMQAQEPGDRDSDGNWSEPWYNLTTRRWGSGPTSSGTQMSWIDLWAHISLGRRAYAEYHQTYNSNDYWSRRSATNEYVSASTKDARLANVCKAAKDNDVVVFAIGFEVTDHSAAVMKNCASSPNHFYRVEGLDINYAFASIKNQINQLKLTQ